MYGIGNIAPNSVQNATTIRQGNQSMTQGMQQQIITPKGGSNLGGMIQNHGSIIQGNNNRMLNQMIQKQTIGSGRRERGAMNSTTLRT